MRMMPRAAPSAMRGWGVRRRCQALLVSVQNNGIVNSEPEYLACEESPIRTFYFRSSSVALLASTVG